jgi:hypothetical protein
MESRAALHVMARKNVNLMNTSQNGGKGSPLQLCSEYVKPINFVKKNTLENEIIVDVQKFDVQRPGLVLNNANHSMASLSTYADGKFGLNQLMKMGYNGMAC